MLIDTTRIGRWLLAPVALAALLTLAACGGGESPEADATATVAATPTTEAATATATSEPGGSGRVAEDGDSVAVHYRGTTDDGEEFDSSRGRGPLEFVVGAGQMIAGFDAAVQGMAVGDSVTVRLEPTEAYGERDESLILEFPASDAPEGLTVGDPVTLNNGARAVVLEVTDEIVRIDANHQLAGQALTFEIEMVSIN
jgi:FKBP-type peptidyl-prolyl cis-trans isomerase 2/predicted small lipoprotein YifL